MTDTCPCCGAVLVRDSHPIHPPVTITHRYARYTVENVCPGGMDENIPESQGPEMTKEQVEFVKAAHQPFLDAFKRNNPEQLNGMAAYPEKDGTFKAVWQPFIDVLKGNAP